MTDRALLRTIVKPRHREVTDEELALFEATCERTGLDPLARQIYAQFRTDSRTSLETMAIQATIDGFRVVAERSGDYLGGDAPEWCGTDGVWRDVWLEGAPAAARVTVHKSVNGQVGDTTVVAHWREYAPTGAAAQMWTKMPALMLAKVAEALCLRRAFPMVLSGIYTSEEMAQATPAPVDELPAEPAVVTNPDAVVVLKAAAKAAGLNWGMVKECYAKAELTAPVAFSDAFSGLSDEQASRLLAVINDRLIAGTTDVPYPAAEVAPAATGGDTDLPWSGDPDSGAPFVGSSQGDAATAEPTEPRPSAELDRREAAHALIGAAGTMPDGRSATDELIAERRAEANLERPLTEDEAATLLTDGKVPEPKEIPALTEADLLVVDALRRGDCKRAKVAEILGIPPEAAGQAVAELKAKLGVRSGAAVIELADRVTA